jgi:hypothetical protein
LALFVGALPIVMSLPPWAINSLGEFISINDLPESNTKRWVIQRKAKVVAGIISVVTPLE